MRIALDEHELRHPLAAVRPKPAPLAQHPAGPDLASSGRVTYLISGSRPSSGAVCRVTRLLLGRTSEEDGYERSDHLPADIAEMSESQLAALPPRAEAREVDKTRRGTRLAEEGLCQFDAALDAATASRLAPHCVNPARLRRRPHISDGPLRLKFELPKKVSWNQKQLGEIAERIVASGEKVEGYLDIKLSVSESRYTNWLPAQQQQFAAARTVDAASRPSPLSIDGVTHEKLPIVSAIERMAEAIKA